MDYDADNDGLIEVKTLAQLNAMRWDVDGDGVSPTAGYATAFRNPEDNMGCNESAVMISAGTGNPACNGYELAANLDLNALPYNTGAGWTPIGDAANPTPPISTATAPATRFPTCS